MSNETQRVSVSNQTWSVVDYILWGCIIGWIAFLSGCDTCKGTNSGTQCFGKSVGELYKEIKIGFDVGTK